MMNEKEITSNVEKYWKENQCQFFIELDKWMRINNICIVDGQEIQVIYNEFILFNTYKGVFCDDHIDHLIYWLENATQITFTYGYSSDIWEKNKQLINKCHEYDFIRKYDHPEDFIKKVCKDLGITQKEFAEAIGASAGTVRNWSSSNYIPLWATKSINLLMENKKNNEIVSTLKHLISLLK